MSIMSSTMSSSNLELDSMLLIPELEETPMTLEEILELDLDKNIQEFALPVCDDFDTGFLETPEDSNGHHLSVTELPFVKTQIANAKQPNIDSGNPTSITCSKNLVAVGTFNGHILLFNSQRLRLFLKHEGEFGTISAMAINVEESRLMCGGGKGGISLWNLESGEMMRIVENIHASFSSVIGLKYLSDDSHAVLADTSGSVFLLDARKKDFDSNCVFTGSRGEVLAIQPLILHKPEERDAFHGIEPICMMAMATVSKVIVVSLKPNLFVHFTFQLKGNPEFLPLLAWNFTFKLEKPHLLLMFARENHLHIYHVDTTTDDRIQFVPFYRFETPGYNLQNIFWIEEDTMLLLDTQEKIHLVDFGDELETTDISQVELVYERANYKSIINGGLVSKAMARAGEHACINSITLRHESARTVLYLLGVRSVFEVKLQTWQERMDHFVQCGKSLQAMQVAQEELGYLQHSVNGKRKTRKEILSKLENSLQSFQDLAFEKGLGSSQDASKVRAVLKIILQHTFLFDESKEEKIFALYEQLDGSGVARECLIESLEEFIFSHRIESLNPLLIKEIIGHYLKKGWIDLLDGIITRFDIVNLDLNYVMNIALDKELYDTFLYVNNVAFREYISPFDTLLKILAERCTSESQFSKSDILLGNKLLMYLCSMLTCTNYPNKRAIDEDLEVEHLTQVYDRLILFDLESSTSDVLDILFKFDPVEYLNVILIAFEFIQNRHPESPWRQDLIDFYIIKIMIQEGNFDSEQRNAFFIFLARCLITFPNVEMSKNHFLTLVNCLFTPRTVKKFDERQQILIQLFHHSFRRQFYQESDFLNKALENEMFKICDFIHRKNFNWAQLFLIYLKDDDKKEEVFDYIHSVLSNETLLLDSRRDFLELVFKNYLSLIQIDSAKAVNIFYAHFDGTDDFYERVLESLQADPRSMFEFMSFTVFKQRKKIEKAGDEVPKASIRLCTKAEYQELFIDLACQLGSNNLIAFIGSLKEADNLKVLESCQKYSMKEGEALLYEMLNQHSKSFEILFEDFKERGVSHLIKTCFADLANSQQNYSFHITENQFDILLNLCIRSFKNSVSKAQNFCLELLEYLIDIKTSLNKIEGQKFDKLATDSQFSCWQLQEYSLEASRLARMFNRDLSKIFEQLLNTMINWMNSGEFFRVIRGKILQQNEDIMDLKEIVLCILENYHYESNLLQLTNSIVAHEQHSLLNRLVSSNVRSTTMDNFRCSICKNSILTSDLGGSDSNSAILYGCKHVFHRTCHEESLKKHSADDDDYAGKNDSLECPLCSGLISQNSSHPEGEANDGEDNSDSELLKLLDSLVPKKITKLSLNASQYRALNHFHQNRFRMPKANS